MSSKPKSAVVGRPQPPTPLFPPPSMTPSKDKLTGTPIVLTSRDRQVITDVADFGVLTREQLQRLGHFQSRTRANATLLRLVRHRYLTRRTLPSVAGTHKSLYLLGLCALDVLDRP